MKIASITEQPITIIQPKASLFRLNLGDIWRYRDLIRMFVIRDFTTLYKQTILGPLWFFIQPIFSSAMYMLIFGKLANISTDSTPQLLFYMAGVINWTLFSSCLNNTADTFIINAEIFGKIYFPRLTVPVTNILMGAIKYVIQFVLFLIFYCIFLFKGFVLSSNWMIILTPLVFMYIAVLATGYGLWISSVTTKYRDLRFALSFIIQLWMYATPVVYPLSLVPDKYKVLMIFNPLAPAIEIFRLAYLGAGTIIPEHFFLSLLLTLLITFTGIIIFNKTEKTFMDTI